MSEDQERKESPINLEPTLSEIEGKTKQEIAELIYELRSKLTKDELTGLLKKEAWLESSEKVLEEDRRIAFDLGGAIKNSSLIVIDLDGFKRLNDELGHDIGDTALQTFADVLAENVNRSSDIIGRWGGDEFMIFLPRTTKEDANKIKEKIFSSLKEIESSQEGNLFAEYPLKASIGIAEIGRDETIPLALNRADKLMYKEKQEKKND